MVHHGLPEGQGLQVLAFGQTTVGNGPLVKWSKTPASHAGNMGSNPVRVTKDVTAYGSIQIDGG